MLFQELSKLKRSSIMLSIGLMALGIVMMMCPEPYVMSLVDVIGFCMLICSCVMIMEFIASKKVMMDYINFTLALIMVILGSAVLVFSDNIVKVIGLIFGLWLIIASIVDIVNAWMYTRRSQKQGWWVLIVLSALQILFGLIILINPWWDSPHALFMVIGGVLLFSSAVAIARLVFIWPIKSE